MECVKDWANLPIRGMSRWPVGTAVLAKVQGWKVQWPAAVWSVGLCLRMDMEQLLDSYRPGA